MLMRTDPFRDLDRITQQVFGTMARPTAMPIDAYRRGDELVVHVDLPGVAPDSIDLTVEQNVLTVHASRERTSSDDDEMLIGERSHGSFSRQLFLGESLDTDRIDASCTDGVLTLRIPVADRAKPRRVEVSVGDRRAAAIEARAEEVTPDGTHADESTGESTGKSAGEPVGAAV